MYRFSLSIVLLCLITLTAYSAHAVERDKFREKFHDRIETLTMWRMMQALDLDTETSEKILQVRAQFLSRRKELRKSLNQAYRDLKKYLEEPPSEENDKKLSETMENMRKARRGLHALWEQQFDAVAKVLPVRKQAELAVFMRDFRKEIKSMLRGPGGRRHHPRFERRFGRDPGRWPPMGDRAGPPTGPSGRRMGPPPRQNADEPGRSGHPERWDPPGYPDDVAGE